MPTSRVSSSVAATSNSASYDNGGEVLRFDPSSGQVDLRIEVGPPGLGAAWYNDSLWVRQPPRATSSKSHGRARSFRPARVKSRVLVWVTYGSTTLTTGLISSLATADLAPSAKS